MSSEEQEQSMYLPPPSESSFELPPAGTHLAVCYRVVDLGTQRTTYLGQEKTQHKVMIGWELPDEKMSDGRPFTINQRYTWSMSEKASLRKHLESWRGVPFKESDFGPDGFDIRNVLGKACLLTIVHDERNGKQYANISAVSRLMKGQSAPTETVNEKVYLWLHESRWEPSTFHKLSDGLKQTIMASPEYKSVANGADEPMHHIPDADQSVPDDAVIPF